MSDRLQEIRARNYSASYDQTAGCNCFEQCWADTNWLLNEVKRLQALELEREKNLQRITELGQEIELLRRDHADGLKVTGVREGK